MYAVIRAGGKQYRVAPGDVIRVEKATGDAGNLEFEVLAFSDNGKVSGPQGDAHVVGEIMGEGRAKKILVFHYKSKKQYKKLNGHRQPFTAVRITEIAFDGQTHKAPELPKSTAGGPKATEGGAAPSDAVKPSKKGGTKKSTSGAAAGTMAPHGGTAKPKRGGSAPKPGK